MKTLMKKLLFTDGQINSYKAQSDLNASACWLTHKKAFKAPLKFSWPPKTNLNLSPSVRLRNQCLSREVHADYK